MKVTTRARYAVTALIDLALNGRERAVPLAEVAERQGLSLRYLEQIFCALKRAGIVCSARGPGGGYRLCECSSRISVADIVSAVEEPAETEQADEACGAVHRALVAEFWGGLSACMREYLEQATLASLCECAGRCTDMQDGAGLELVR